MAIVVRANKESSELGGHIATYQSVATLYEVGFNHFFCGPDHRGGGDQIYFQGNASPGIYARAFLEDRLSANLLENFRRELAPGGGLSSYPHPWLMPKFWEHPTVSMGIGPLKALSFQPPTPQTTALFETSFDRIYDKHFIVVRVEGDGAAGYGECVAERDPYYSAETNETVWHIIAEFIAPRVVGVEVAHPREIFGALKAIRGHNMAKAAVEMAAWDLYAKQRGEPLSRTLGGTRERIESVVHLAAFALVAESVAQPQKYVANNVTAARVLLEAVARARIRRFVFSSSGRN